MRFVLLLVFITGRVCGQVLVDSQMGAPLPAGVPLSATFSPQGPSTGTIVPQAAASEPSTIPLNSDITEPLMTPSEIDISSLVLNTDGISSGGQIGFANNLADQVQNESPLANSGVDAADIVSGTADSVAIIVENPFPFPNSALGAANIASGAVDSLPVHRENTFPFTSSTVGATNAATNLVNEVRHQAAANPVMRISNLQNNRNAASSPALGIDLGEHTKASIIANIASALRSRTSLGSTTGQVRARPTNDPLKASVANVSFKGRLSGNKLNSNPAANQFSSRSGLAAPDPINTVSDTVPQNVASPLRVSERLKNIVRSAITRDSQSSRSVKDNLSNNGRQIDALRANPALFKQNTELFSTDLMGAIPSVHPLSVSPAAVKRSSVFHPSKNTPTGLSADTAALSQQTAIPTDPQVNINEGAVAVADGSTILQNHPAVARVIPAIIVPTDSVPGIQVLTVNAAVSHPSISNAVSQSAAREQVPHTGSPPTLTSAKPQINVKPAVSQSNFNLPKSRQNINSQSNFNLAKSRQNISLSSHRLNLNRQNTQDNSNSVSQFMGSSSGHRFGPLDLGRVSAMRLLASISSSPRDRTSG